MPSFLSISPQWYVTFQCHRRRKLVGTHAGQLHSVRTGLSAGRLQLINLWDHRCPEAYSSKICRGLCYFYVNNYVNGSRRNGSLCSILPESFPRRLCASMFDDARDNICNQVSGLSLSLLAMMRLRGQNEFSFELSAMNKLRVCDVLFLVLSVYYQYSLSYICSKSCTPPTLSQTELASEVLHDSHFDAFCHGVHNEFGIMQ